MVLLTEVGNIGRGDRYCMCVWWKRMRVEKAKEIKYLIWGRSNLRFENIQKV